MVVSKEQLAELNKQYKEGTLSLEQYNKKLAALAGIAVGTTTALTGLSAASSGLKKALGLSENEINNMGDASSTLNKAIAKFIGLMGPTIALTKKWGSAFANPIGKLGSLTSILGTTNQTIKNLRTTQLTAREAVAKFGGSMEHTRAEVRRYPRNLRRTAFALGITADKLNDLVRQSSMVPNSLRPIDLGLQGIAGRAGETALPIAVLETTMRGMGFAAGASTAMAKDGFEAFGQEIPKVVSEMGRMAAAASGVAADTSRVAKQIVNASKNLAIFGTGIGSATNLWRTFATTLQSGGVPIAQIGSIVEKVTAGIAGMSVQQRAFISMMGGRGGGRGALSGALRMELEMRQPGGMNRQLQDLTRTLSRFGGGRIITLEQAVKQPGMEQQFLLQRQMLGKLGIQGTAEQQNRILEVLNKVQSGGISQVEGNKALNDVFKAGKSIQERTLTSIERSEQWLRIIAGEKVDQKINDFDATMDKGLESLQKVIAGTGVDKSILADTKEYTKAQGRLLANITQIPKTFFAPRKEGRAGDLVMGKKGFAEVFAESARVSAKIMGRYENAKLTRGTPVRAPSKPTLRARVAARRAPATPSFRALTATVSSGDIRKTRLLQQIRDLTKQNTDLLRVTTNSKKTGGLGVAPPTTEEAGGTTNTLLIRIIGGEGAQQIQEQSYKMTLGRQE